MLKSVIACTARYLFLAALIWPVAFLSSGAQAQQAFKNPEQAADALAAAVRGGDPSAIVEVLGKTGADIVSSGDAAEDRSAGKLFLAGFDEGHRIEQVAEKHAVLIIGAIGWPFPIPIVQQGDSWKFDTAAGREEVLYRRIGRNESDAIQTCLAYVDAQNEYADMNAKNGPASFAQVFVSAPGKKDGLYWPAREGEAQSPLGEFVAVATDEGYRIGGGRTPYHGYYYKILKRQGASAPGGAVNYLVNGKMIGGFALVASPAAYGNSGVMTFLVNHRGEVFQKDLGPSTAKAFEAMTAYNPDHTWKKASTEPLQ